MRAPPPPAEASTLGLLLRARQGLEELLAMSPVQGSANMPSSGGGRKAGGVGVVRQGVGGEGRKRREENVYPTTPHSHASISLSQSVDGVEGVEC